MKCPRCGDAEMFEKDREGITIDVCQKCRGIFLDRGELEKLVAFAANDDPATTGQRPVAAAPPNDPRHADPRHADPRRRDRDSDPPSSDYGRKRHGHPHRKEGFLSRLGDFFD